LTKQRCRMEARLLDKCKTKGIDVPNVLRVESIASAALIYLEYLEGKTVRDVLDDDVLPQLGQQPDEGCSGAARDATSLDAASATITLLHQLAQEIGSTVAKLHAAGMVHGDLTTSNMMLKQQQTTTTDTDSLLSRTITLIDFGLAKNTTAAEERAVDLYVLERALQSTHPTLPESFWETALAAYASYGGDVGVGQPLSQKKSSTKQETLTRLDQVRQRGRKRECFG
jgi:TP53 regulating kinase and related kinases